jgi:hypothetical protein
MLENCLSGSEGGGAFALPTPIFILRSVGLCLEVTLAASPRTHRDDAGGAM